MKLIKFSILLVLLTLVLSNCNTICRPITSIEPLYSWVEDDFEKGKWGIGIPQIGVTPPPTPMSVACNKPHGVCSIRQTMPEVHSTTNNNNSYFRIIPGPKDQTIRYEFLKKCKISQSELERLITSETRPEHKEYISKITDHVYNHFFIEKDLEFSKNSSNLIIKSFGLTGKSVVAKTGDYLIKFDDKHPFGYFTINIRLE